MSRVINAHSNVKPATRARVDEAIRQLRYRPSSAARALVTKRSRTIGLITSRSADYGPSMLALAVTEAAAAARYTVVTTTLTDAQPSSVRASIEALLRQNVEAMVLVAIDIAVADIARDQASGAPLVVIAAEAEPHLQSVSIDQYGGARLATRHLLGLGYETVAHVAGPARNPDAVERVRGWTTELSAAGAPPGVRVDADWSARGGYDAGMILPVEPGRTAVFAGNDQMALGLISALRSRGYIVPDMVSVVGFDDIPEAGFFAPPLTTIRQDFESLGALTMQRVLAILEGAPPQEPERPISTRLVIRDSTAPSRD
ncbi:LacI family transcriptional regulator [Pseudolysinimonas kribbensis]|uniref:LacI family transcriptional regulator n=1 Tax=Pseudolysinimonas kribbensis TaxID=433641 RepID=A0ABQ6KDI9_9MICO|nr:substrate-binding domain-containing protein [Pseudolysinimonas kribbensis]GMA96587.1 LacI family transcriptional regulator [Pseudolysinimonas kribbensis]